MATVSLNDITKNAHADFTKLFQKIGAKAIEYNKKFSKGDARREFFMISWELHAWVLIQLDDFLITLDRKSLKVSKYLNLDESDRSEFLSQFDTSNRACYLAKGMFEVEYYVKSIMKHLVQPFDMGYHKLSRELLVTLNRYTVQNHKIMTLPSQTRNALHNNGYTKFDIDVTLRGRRYPAHMHHDG
jgi:hypothetical protein